MSYPFGQSVLTLDEITKAMRACFEGFTDPRRGKNKRYTMTDAADNQIRNLLDATDPKVTRLLFGYLFEGLERSRLPRALDARSTPTTTSTKCPCATPTMPS